MTDRLQAYRKEVVDNMDTLCTPITDRNMIASVLHSPGVVVLEERLVPVPAPDEVLVKVSRVGVCGSDVHYYREGRIGPFVVDRPIILGHEVAGQIVAAGNRVSPARIGERIAIEPQRPCRACSQCRAGRYNLCPHMEFFATPPVDGAFCQFVTVQSDFAYQVPSAVTDEGAALLEPLSVGIAACRRAGIQPGSQVLIAGAGPIGIIALQAATAFGAAEVVVSDPVPDRRATALSFGATAAIDPRSGDLGQADYDAFIDACGIPQAVIDGIQSLRGGGTAVLVGTGFDQIALPIPRIQTRELVVTGVFRYTDTWPLAIHLVATGKVRLDQLVTARFPLAQVEEALEATSRGGNLKVMVTVDSGTELP